MSMCRDCTRRNELCVGLIDFDILKYLDIDLRLRKPYPAKVILGEDVYKYIIKEMREQDVCGLEVNPAGEYKKLFGMDIEIDRHCRNRIAFEGRKY